ncbi:MAG: CocE/NonD family hydrolase C-terminal non-catalytic domain-containing protein, partial [Rhizobiaceae bacterium]
AGLAADAGPLRRAVTSPQDCGLSNGEYFPFMFGPELPSDQRVDDALSACFDTPPLDDALDIVGAARVALTLSSDRPQANLCVRLCDVHPDGASELIAYGLLNLCQHRSRQHPEPLAPGAGFDATIVLDQCAYRIPAGHRLRVALSTACWPMIWPSPETATLSLSAGLIDLPVRAAAAGDEWTFAPPEGASPWRTEELRAATSSKRVVRDMATARTSMIVENDFGALRDLDHGLVNGSRLREEWSIRADDPLSARADIGWEQTGGRGDWTWRTSASGTMTSDREAFHLQARLDAFENERQVFSREWKTTIPRRCI